MSDISIRQMGPKAAKRAIAFAIKMKRPTFLWGPPGIGKSDLGKPDRHQTLAERLLM